MKLLIIEDDVETAAYLAKGLNDSGHATDVAVTGPDGLARAVAGASTGAYDALIVDRMLPGLDGLGVITALRDRGVRTPVLILSALGKVDDRVHGLHAGGDDYLVKPFAFAELLARLEALIRRVGGDTRVATMLKVGGLEMDLLARTVSRDGRRIDLQPREFRLLEKVWDYHFDPQTNVIDVHVSRLRAKIDRGFDPPLLHTVRGAGYTLRVPG